MRIQINLPGVFKRGIEIIDSLTKLIKLKSQLKGGVEAVEELVKSIVYLASTDMLCSDWGQRDR